MAGTTAITGPFSGTKWISQDTTLSSNKATLVQSQETGLRGLVVNTGEPLCSLHIIISTCATTDTYSHKDDGLPHTLEHAIFLGSELYPYKGILDKLANRSLADGTNAWTATDHTAYTLTTAGEEGALNLLPIYADHVLYPTLTDESFLTEVHHVTSSGQDKGVVYCEMQGRENSCGSLVDRAILDLLYPHNCGYSSETGGKLRNLRSLANHQVQRYHAENYTPDNVMFVLSGNVGKQEFLDRLDEVEKRIRSKPDLHRRPERPWINHPVPKLDLAAVGILQPHDDSSDTDKALEISFPSEDESRGTISIAWRGPSYQDRGTWVCLQLLWTYLTESAISPLQKAFVECDDPICADVGPAHEIFTQGYHQLWFQEVDIEKMNSVAPKLFETLKQAGDTLDMDRMRMVIRRTRRQLLEYNERRPTYAMIDGVVRNFMYGSRGDPEREIIDLQADVDELPFLLDALDLEKDYWYNLMDEYVLSKPYALVIGRPSAALAEKMAKDEKEREAQQAQDLGPEKLKVLGEALEKAIEFNERPIPEETLTNIPIPSLDKVKAVPVLTIRGVGKSIDAVENSGRGISKEDAVLVLSQLKDSANRTEAAEAYHIDWSHIESAFLYSTVGLSTKNLTPRQRLYLPLLLELAFKLPAILDDGSELTKDEFVSQLQDDTVSYGARCGLSGSSISQMISVSIQMENPAGGQGLQPALKWIRRVLYLTTLSAELVKITVHKLLSEIAPQIRSGSTICSAVSNELNFKSDEANKVAASPLRQWPFLDDLTKQMEDPNGATKVVEELNAVRRELTHPKNMQVFVTGNLKNMTEPMQGVVNALLPPGESDPTYKGALISDISAATVRSTDTGRAAVCSLSAIESSFLSITSPGVGAYDPNHAALLVAIEYLTALEGDFWVKLRGAGLTYGSSISNQTESKLLKFGLFKCTDVRAAFKAASQILEEYASGKANIPHVGLESAKSALAFNIISSKSTKLSAAINSWVSNYEGKKVDYDQWLLAKIGEVTVEDAMHALVTYLIPLFDPKSNLAVTCPTIKVDEISEYFASRGWTDVQVVSEDKLCKAFTADLSESKLNVPESQVGVSMFMPGAFAAQFQCACPRCERPS